MNVNSRPHIFSQALFFSLSLLIGTSTLFAEETAEEKKESVVALSEGSPFTKYTLNDQFDVSHSLQPDTKLVLISSDMELSKSIHKWLAPKGPDYLKNNKTEYVANITDMPSIISWLFAKPKMRDYPFTILLADDEDFEKKYPSQEGKISAFELDENQQVKGIHFLENMDEVEKTFYSQTSLPAVNDPADVTTEKPAS